MKLIERSELFASNNYIDSNYQTRVNIFRKVEPVREHGNAALEPNEAWTLVYDRVRQYEYQTAYGHLHDYLALKRPNTPTDGLYRIYAFSLNNERDQDPSHGICVEYTVRTQVLIENKFVSTAS